MQLYYSHTSTQIQDCCELPYFKLKFIVSHFACFIQVAMYHDCLPVCNVQTVRAASEQHGIEIVTQQKIFILVWDWCLTVNRRRYCCPSVEQYVHNFECVIRVVLDSIHWRGNSQVSIKPPIWNQVVHVWSTTSTINFSFHYAWQFSFLVIKK